MRSGLDAHVELIGVSKRFEDVVAVDDVSFTVHRGELLTLLGPSGCGKTTTLRMVAGFEQPTAGRTLVEGRDVTYVPPNRRNVGFVFQNYALFPHLSVTDNVAFGLRERKLGRGEIERRVSHYLGLVRLGGFGHRRPRQLSGGQQQRVALARALAIEPTVVLLDEPLGALDRLMREEMQLELRGLLKGLKTTAIFVTHDQDEALSMSDRVAVMNHGRIEQIAPPREIYENPTTAFCASFLGLSNVFHGRVADGALEVSSDLRFACAAPAGERSVMVRPEHVELTLDDRAGAVRGRVASIKYLGASTQYRLELPGGAKLLATVSGARRLALTEGDEAWAWVPPEAWRVLEEPSAEPSASEQPVTVAGVPG